MLGARSPAPMGLVGAPPPLNSGITGKPGRQGAVRFQPGKARQQAPHLRTPLGALKHQGRCEKSRRHATKQIEKASYVAQL
eukprot:COSAG04_NODE_201_length_20457_cov_316.186462_9_plen_81_part_00